MLYSLSEPRVNLLGQLLGGNKLDNMPDLD